MEDRLIIELYFDRSEQAISETQIKYGRMLRSIALHIIGSMQDAEECESDTYMKAWNLIPPKKPDVFSAFLSRITRNLSLDRYDYLHAKKRGGGSTCELLDELAECVPDDRDIRSQGEEKLTEVLNDFLETLLPESRNIFMRRYWFGDSIREIAGRSGSREGRIKMNLLRSRKKLQEMLAKEGYIR